MSNTFVCGGTQTTGFVVWGEIFTASFYNNIFYIPSTGTKAVLILDPTNYTGATPKFYASNNWISTGTAVDVFTAQSLTFSSVSGTAPGFSNLAGFDLRLAAGSNCLGGGLTTTQSWNRRRRRESMGLAILPRSLLRGVLLSFDPFGLLGLCSGLGSVCLHQALERVASSNLFLRPTAPRGRPTCG